MYIHCSHKIFIFLKEMNKIERLKTLIPFIPLVSVRNLKKAETIMFWLSNKSSLD